MAERKLKDSQVSMPSQDTSEYATTPHQLESLMAISSSSSVDAKILDMQAEVKRIVLKTLEQLQSKCQFGDINTLMSLIVPKVLLDMQAHEKLHDEVQSIKQSLNSYMHDSKVVSEDIAEIFLDLHNIYSKLEKIEKREQKTKTNTKKTRNDKFLKRITEANELLKSNKHYINNTNDEASLLAEALATHTSTSSRDASSSSRTDDNISSSDAIKAEKRAFLTNMIMVKKSDFSLELNRNKQFYTEAERALKANTNATKATKATKESS